MLVKVNFGEDIRRFTLEQPFQSFLGLELQLANLYQLPQEQGFKIFYTDNEGDRVILSSNEELSAALSYASEHSNILRLTIELSPQKKIEKTPVSQPKSPQMVKPFVISTGTNTLPPTNSSLGTNTLPLITSSASTNTNSVQKSTASTNVEVVSTSSVGLNTIPEDKVGKIIDELDMDELLAHPKFQEKLSVIISHAISTQAFSQLLQSMLPQMRDILKESIKVTTLKGNEPNMNVPSKKLEQLPSVASTSTSSSSSSDFSNPPIVTLIPNIEGSVEIKASLSDVKLPTPSSSSSSNDQILFKKEKDPIAEFAVIPEETKKTEKEQKSSTPLIDSFLSLFKPNNNNNSNSNSNNNNNSPTNKKQTVDSSTNTKDSENEEVNIPNLEELLSQLEAMGFYDKELNIKTLRFHKKFNEGLDEVVEDLLGQQAKQEK